MSLFSPPSPLRPLGSLVLLGLVGAGCSDGTVDGELVFQVNAENYSYFEDVLFPSQRAGQWAEIFAPRSAYVDFGFSYTTETVSALITQQGDLQITAHLSLGKVLKEAEGSGTFKEDFGYLKGELYNEALGNDEEGNPLAVGQALYDELEEGSSRGYHGLDGDIRLVMVVNLPDDTDTLEEEWFGEDAYPKNLVANYGVLDEDGYHLPDDQIQLAAFLLLGREKYDTDYDPTADHVDLVLESFVHPDDPEGGDGLTRGTVDLALTDATLAALGATGTLKVEFEVTARKDPWGLEQVDEEEGSIDSGP